MKHRYGDASIKMYDKAGIVLRIEVTANDVSFFKHHRKVEHRNGMPAREYAAVKKTIYSLIDLREIPLACNRRYLAHLAAPAFAGARLDDDTAGIRAPRRVTKPRAVEGKTVKGINFFEPGDSALSRALRDPKSTIAG